MISKKQYSTKIATTFIHEVDSLVANNLGNVSFCPDYLSQELGLSKMQVYRKIKLATGKSTSIYIRYLRLCHSKQILMQTDWPISQVAYHVGFQAHSYFSRAFSEEFGISPSVFRRKSLKMLL